MRAIELNPEILLVEDNDDDAEIVNSIFEKNHIDHIIRRARNGEDAIEYLMQSGNAAGDKANYPQVVLLDINLPKMSGIDVLRRIRSNPRTEHIPVFVFTSSTSDYNTFESYRLGVTSYISKTTSYEKLEMSVLETDLFLKNYKVLIVEDNASDAAIIVDRLSNSYVNCNCYCVDNKDDYKKALTEFKPDIILSDYELPPKFDAIQAVRLLKQTDLLIPFILITGKLNADLASACLTEGMDDYLLKGNLERLPVTLINNLRKKKIEVEKMKAIEKLASTQNELKMLVDSIDEMFFSIDMVNNKLIQISSACENIYGYPKEQFLATPDMCRRCVHPEDLHMLLNADKKVAKGETVFNEFRIIRSDGQVRWVQKKVKPTLNQFGDLIRIDGLIADVTNRKNTEVKLLESEGRFRELFENAPEGIAVYNPETDRFVDCNKKTYELLKYTKEELLSKSPLDISPVYQADGVSSMIKAEAYIIACINGERPVFEWLVTDADGNRITCEMRLARASDVNNNIYASLIDISDRKQSESEKERVTESIMNRNHALEQFSYIISHNLRAPIANIMGLAEIFNTQKMQEDEKAFCINGLGYSALKLDEVVRDINDILNLKKGLAIDKTELHFSELMTDITNVLRAEIDASQTEIIEDFEDADEICSLRGYLYSILLNLTTNSIKYRQKNIAPVVEISTVKLGEKIILHFKDNGMGIELSTNKEDVFGLYKRFHTHVGGKGMGLCMVKAQVETLGGTIDIRSEVNKGTEFIIELPL